MKKMVDHKFDLIVFDIDGTLTASKLPIDSEMAILLSKLIEKYKVAIISGANFEQFKWQILGFLKCSTERMKDLLLLPVDGTIFCSYKDDWQCKSDKPLSTQEKNHIRKTFENVFQDAHLEQPDKIYGELLEDRGSQLNFSALGQDAPPELKEKWDPDNSKRKRIIDVFKPALLGLSTRIGGTTSIEIAKSGIDKAYGLNKLMRLTGISKENILYIGDKFFEGGNDAPIKTLGVEYREVKEVEETKEIILELLRS